tara:strand:+ start:550 stop:711 length:162 start_codon:yes stop_codon:yes gene_type:complete
MPAAAAYSPQGGVSWIADAALFQNNRVTLPFILFSIVITTNRRDESFKFEILK